MCLDNSFLCSKPKVLLHTNISHSDIMAEKRTHTVEAEQNNKGDEE